MNLTSTPLKMERVLEYLERVNLLNPIARVRFPEGIARRFEAGRENSWAIILPVELDEARLEAAATLRNALFHVGWYLSGTDEHSLDAVRPEHQEFIIKEFEPTSFVAWDDLSIPIWMDEDGHQIRDSRTYTPTYYHYWQIFALASILRSGATILYPFNDKSIVDAMWDLNISVPEIRKQLYASLNIEAHHELYSIIKHTPYFEAVAYFEAYRTKALFEYRDQADKKTRLLPKSVARAYKRRELEIAKKALKTLKITKSQMLNFLGEQAEWWDTAKSSGPERVAEEYARNISVTIELYRIVSGEELEVIINKVGTRGGWFKPILKVIFPDWIEEQRDLATRTLNAWAAKHINGLPAPFPCTATDIEDFCNWLEKAGLFQYYWHFSRFAEFERINTPIYKAAASAEAVAFANLVEMIANKVFENRGYTPRGNVLSNKLYQLFDNSGPVNLKQLLIDFKRLANTNRSTLKKRLAQIDRLKKGGQHAPVLRALLKLSAIRNEGSHLGLNKFERAEILGMLETMAIASLIIWKAR